MFNCNGLLKDTLDVSLASRLLNADVLGSNLAVELITRTACADLSMCDGSVTFECASAQ